MKLIQISDNRYINIEQIKLIRAFKNDPKTCHYWVWFADTKTDNNDDTILINQNDFEKIIEASQYFNYVPGIKK